MDFEPISEQATKKCKTQLLSAATRQCIRLVDLFDKSDEWLLAQPNIGPKCVWVLRHMKEGYIKPEMTGNEKYIAACNEVVDPIEALEIVRDAESMLGDFYYQELTSAVWRMVDRVIAASNSST